jgi:hypothetical protein
MAHFAQLDENNIVTQVIVINNQELLNENNVEQEEKGIAFCQSLLGGNWKQTSYNANIRKNYAGAGCTYDAERNAFIPPKPYASWILNEDTCRWEAPIVYPEDGKAYAWNEETVSWQEVIRDPE